jgi:hypothetical protein
LSAKNQDRQQWFLPAVFWLLVLLVAAWAYNPGVNGPAMLDDRASVMVLNILEENPSYAIDAVLGDNAGPLGRPVAMATFVLEKLYFDGGISGSKRINILLHLFNGCMVLWLFTLLFRPLEHPAASWLAVLLAASWLLSPIYVSTVLYVVQRMAMLAAFFMLAACISYLYWRLSLSAGHFSSIRLILVFLFIALAVFSKETAIVIVPILLLLEALWLGFKGPGGSIIPWLRLVTWVLIGLGASSLLLFFTVNADWLLSSYDTRPFTLYERVLTQSRILWDYVGQIYSPQVLVMGLYHDDIVVSQSLSGDHLTFISVIAWLSVLVGCAVSLLLGVGRYVVFAILLYLVGHSTESTILALELYYEHRNYFPGVGLFLLLGVVTIAAINRFPELKAPLLVLLGGYVIWLASQTGSQVQIWSNKSLLRLNDVNAHPASFRANVNMASEMAHIGELDAALEYSFRANRASLGERRGDLDIRDLALSCMANSPLPLGRVASIGTVDAARPLSSVATLNVLVRLLQDDVCPNFDRMVFADRMRLIFLEEGHIDKAAANIYSRLAVLENALERYENAYAYMALYLSLSPDDIEGLLMQLHFSTALDYQDDVVLLKSKLQTMDEAGKLTLAQKNTLSLYLEN